MDGKGAASLLADVRSTGPLVQCITNFVSMDIMANVLLAFGASPAMAHSLDEVEEFIGISSALVVNMGTLDPSWVAAMKLCTAEAKKLGKPWILDPVGCGATTYRTAAILSMLKCGPTVVRGNAGEIMAIAGATGTTKGVDSTASPAEALDAAKALAVKYNTVIAVSGDVDHVTDGRRVLRVANGIEMLTKITAAGCSLNAVIAACLAVRPDDTLVATAQAMALYGLAAELAEETAPVKAPGSVRVALLDQLYLMDESAVTSRARLSEAE